MYLPSDFSVTAGVTVTLFGIVLFEETEIVIGMHTVNNQDTFKSVTKSASALFCTCLVELFRTAALKKSNVPFRTKTFYSF